MNTAIRVMTEEDKDCVMEMMEVFYASPAVLSNGSAEIFKNDAIIMKGLKSKKITGF